MMPTFETDRFTTEQGLRITVQVPEMHVRERLDAVCAESALAHGDYDHVSFTTAPGVQRFRSSGRGRNAATTGAVEVPCMELSFFLPDNGIAADVVKTIYARHPYEEPVIYVQPCVRTLHIRGLDEDNPNRFWNRETLAWVPFAHQS